MSPEKADLLLKTEQDRLRAEGYTEKEVVSIIALASTVLIILNDTGAPLADRLFVPALHIASHILAAKQDEPVVTAPYDMPVVPGNATKH